jgi:hypothetical protein
MARRGGARVKRVALIVTAAIAGLVIVLLGVAQLVLPSIAADRLRDELSAHGSVQSVTVRAFPAVKLLAGRADSVTIRMKALRSAVRQSGDLLARADHTDRLEVTIATASIGPLALHDVRVLARDGKLDARAAVSAAALRAALPPGLDVAPIASGDGRLLLRGSASLFGIGLSAEALLSTVDGTIVVEPVGLPFGSLARFTVYADNRIAITSLGASAYPGGYNFTAAGKLTA